MEFDPEAFEASVVAKCAVDHTRVYACVFHEGYCVATTSDGRVVVWNVHRHLGTSGSLAAAASPPAPDAWFQAHVGAVFSACFVPAGPDSAVLVTGGQTELRYWRWGQVVEAVVAAAGGAGASSTELSLVPAFEARNPAPLDTRTAFHLSETNALTWDSTVGRLLSAAGDNTVYAWDVTVPTAPVGRFSGHDGYVHDVCCAPAVRALASASEDGSVKLWDAATQKCIHTFRPTAEDAPSLPSTAGTLACGRESWCGSVTVDTGGHWLACGSGDGSLSVYHVGSRNRTSKTTVMDPGTGQAAAITALRYHDGQLVAASLSPTVSWLSLSGELRRSVATKVPSCYGLGLYTQRGYECLAVCGSSPLVDVCVSFGSRSFSLATADPAPPVRRGV